ncbi:hypothetical protein BJL95_22555 [Methylomonas sp. LWB]|nr:hypothetical protein BJL95_22555 [Methylomonas sp. LWB]
MPDIEDYIGEKVPVRAIDQELLIEDVIKPERREPRERVPAHGKRPPRGDKPERDRRPRPHREHGQPATTAPASAPENLPQPETP